jgi:Fe-S-cluster formation regulator IscX/YfhJ
MNWNEKQTVRIAILDLYEGVANQGMRGLREIVRKFGEIHQVTIELDEFDCSFKK